MSLTFQKVKDSENVDERASLQEICVEGRFCSRNLRLLYYSRFQCSCINVLQSVLFFSWQLQQEKDAHAVTSRHLSLNNEQIRQLNRGMN